ncbi:MAG: hypothetical protein JNK34_11130 [Tabrizicola sp.]|nr:hypothetical protein [Tabrizicola sp.]
MIGNLRAAQIASDVMRHPDFGPDEKQLAERQYREMSDAVIADLGLLSEQRVLARVTLFLSKRERV